MKLAVLGVVTAGIGVALGLPGLVGIGAFWVLIGPVMRLHGQRLKSLQEASGRPTLDGATFAQGTLLWFTLGIPSLLVGVLRIGIDGEHGGWRWLPLAIGILALTIGVVGAALYLLGGAVADRGPARAEPVTADDVPARLEVLERLHQDGTITDEEHLAERKRILGTL